MKRVLFVFPLLPLLFWAVPVEGTLSFFTGEKSVQTMLSIGKNEDMFQTTTTEIELETDIQKTINITREKHTDGSVSESKETDYDEQLGEQTIVFAPQRPGLQLNREDLEVEGCSPIQIASGAEPNTFTLTLGAHGHESETTKGTLHVRAMDGFYHLQIPMVCKLTYREKTEITVQEATPEPVTPTPGEPGEPGPGTPTPGQPGEPGGGTPTPGQPGPGEPGGGTPTPGQPGEPGGGTPTPGQPGEPGGGTPAPGQPGEPGGGTPTPGQPGEPGTGTPTPGQPGEPGGGTPTPEQPGEPGTSTPEAGQAGGDPGAEKPTPGGDQPGDPGTGTPDQPEHSLLDHPAIKPDQPPAERTAPEHPTGTLRKT